MSHRQPVTLLAPRAAVYVKIFRVRNAFDASRSTKGEATKRVAGRATSQRRGEKPKFYSSKRAVCLDKQGATTTFEGFRGKGMGSQVIRTQTLHRTKEKE